MKSSEGLGTKVNTTIGKMDGKTMEIKRHSFTLLSLSLIHVLLHVALSFDFGGLYSGDQCCACGFKVRSLNAFPCLLTTIEAEAGSQCTSLSLSLSVRLSLPPPSPHSLAPATTLFLTVESCCQHWFFSVDFFCVRRFSVASQCRLVQTSEC